MKKQVLAKDIKTLRKYLIVTQAEFALLFKVTAVSISHWEDGTKLPNYRNYTSFVKNLSIILQTNLKTTQKE
ncbi:hypothetical protein MNB_SUP05-SYMBIONT-5-185 [hydrothermal vent metagenome]|uniref:HTH cro/C1-type domain-containing protein n=1 Tax=hydrothermal vent metagenome TaxID=652676 RepID=A0A1W1E5H5_9ZZZZ